MKKIGWILGGLLLLFVIFGNSGNNIANWIWTETAAPWEEVNAFYYPDRSNLSEDKRALDIGSVEACRDWVDEQARAAGDPEMLNSDYECGVGCKTMSGGMYVCRLTIE